MLADASTSWRDALLGGTGARPLCRSELPAPTVLEERERHLGQPRGLARGHLRTVHAHGCSYDMQIDTSTAQANELAGEVLTRLEQGPRTNRLQQHDRRKPKRALKERRAVWFNRHAGIQFDELSLRP